jgi:hypothetical protein
MGASSWSYSPCAKCRDEMLHRHGRCTHCGTGLPVGKVRDVDMSRGRRRGFA